MRVVLLLVVFFPLAALLAGCQTASYQGNENSPYYVVPAGSRLTLNQELTIPPEATSVYIQNGQVMPNVQVLHYYPFCKFELYHRSDSARAVAPDTVTITKTVPQESDSPDADAGPIHYAAGMSASMTDISPGGYVPIRTFSTRMDLRAEKNPDIFRLTCSRWGYPNMDTYVTIAEMRRTLGPIFTLSLPGSGG
jgi:hypothetical protein